VILVTTAGKVSADSPIARRRGQTQIEAGLAAAGIPHTLLRSNAYMQNALALAPAITATSSFGSATGKGRAGIVDARDVAAVAAAIAAAPPRTPARPTGSPARNWSPTTTRPPCCQSSSARPAPTGNSPSRSTG